MLKSADAENETHIKYRQRVGVSQHLCFTTLFFHHICVTVLTCQCVVVIAHMVAIFDKLLGFSPQVILCSKA